MSKTRRTGSIIKRGSDSWQVRLSNGAYPDGRRRFHTSTVKGTKRDAERYLNDRIRERDFGTLIETSKISLNEYFERWLEDVSRVRTCERTSDGRGSLYDRYFRQTIGQKRLDKLEILDIQNVYAAMLQRGLSARTVRHAHTVLRCALKQAVKWNLLIRNPAEFAELPKVYRQDRTVLTAEQSRSFIKASEAFRFGLVFEFALLTGMRPEEYLAVQWGDIDISTYSVQVKRALIRHKGGWQFKEPKTSRSRRRVTLPRPLIAKLTVHRQTQLLAKFKASNLWEDHDLVFSSEFGTPLSIPNLTYRYYRPILEAAGLPRIRLYDLRHTHATLLLAADEHPKVVAERLGHSTIVQTLDTYSHVLPTMQKRATDKLEKMIFG